jgi:hypothetical protein
MVGVGPGQGWFAEIFRGPARSRSVSCREQGQGFESSGLAATWIFVPESCSRWEIVRMLIASMTNWLVKE